MIGNRPASERMSADCSTAQTHGLPGLIRRTFMKKRSLLIAATSCFIGLAPAAYARSAYDGSWDLVFVTQRGACDSSYSFTVDVTNGNRHASQSREISRLRCKIRRGSRFGDSPG
jgi:hypothetical protein